MGATFESSDRNAWLHVAGSGAGNHQLATVMARYSGLIKVAYITGERLPEPEPRLL